MEEFRISYTDNEEQFPEYVRAFVVNDKILGYGVRINTGVSFTIKPEDAINLGHWLINAFRGDNGSGK